MDKAALQDLFSYTGWAWDQIKAAVPDDKMLRAVAPGSGWPALRNCLAHIVLGSQGPTEGLLPAQLRNHGV